MAGEPRFNASGQVANKRRTMDSSRSLVANDEIEVDSVMPLVNRRRRSGGNLPDRPSSSAGPPATEVPLVGFRGDDPSVVAKFRQLGALMTELMPPDDLVGNNLNRKWVVDFLQSFLSTASLANTYDQSARAYIAATKEELEAFRQKNLRQQSQISGLEREVKRLKATTSSEDGGDLELKVVVDSLNSRIADMERELELYKEKVAQAETEKASALSFASAEEERANRTIELERARVNAEIEGLRLQRGETSRLIAKNVRDELNVAYGERFEKLRRYFQILKDLRTVDLKRSQAVGTRECLQMLSDKHGVSVPDVVWSVLDKSIDEFTDRCSVLNSALPVISPSDLEVISFLPSSALPDS